MIMLSRTSDHTKSKALQQYTPSNKPYKHACCKCLVRKQAVRKVESAEVVTEFPLRMLCRRCRNELAYHARRGNNTKVPADIAYVRCRY